MLDLEAAVEPGVSGHRLFHPAVRPGACAWLTTEELQLPAGYPESPFFR
jgi:hypothetical protein